METQFSNFTMPNRILYSTNIVIGYTGFAQSLLPGEAEAPSLFSNSIT